MNPSPSRFVGPLEKPKTANKAFGGISDYLLFFENREPKIKTFVKEYKEIEKMDSEFSIPELNKVIAPKVDQCLTEMHKKSGTSLKNKYVGLFTRTFQTWEQFYNGILNAYTIAGFLYEKMNEFLRNENWEELDDLLPYTYCLFKAFLWAPSVDTSSKNFDFLKSRLVKNKLKLYRGADFDSDSLEYYDKSKITYFAWNGVISTSLIPEATEKFKNQEKGKTPIMIYIDVDFEGLEHQDFIALFLANISAHPDEQEVALAPGSIFELLEIDKEGPEVVMKLRLVTNAKDLAHKGQFLHGMLQTVMRNESELKIVCLEGRDLSRAIKHCKANQLITDLEFSLCNFDEWSEKVLLNVLPTIKSLASFTFNSVILKGKCLDQIMKCLGDLKVKKLKILNSLGDENDIKSFIACIEYFGSLESLRLNFAEGIKINGILVRELYNKVIQYLDSECVFELNIINDCDIVVKGLKMSNFKQNFGNSLNKKWLTKSKSSEEKIKDSYFRKLQDEDQQSQIIDTEQKEIKLSKEKFEKENEEKEDSKDETSPKQIAKSPHEESTLNLIGKKDLFGYSLRDNSGLPKRSLLEALEDKYIFSQPSVELKGPAAAGKQSLETLNLNFEKCENLHDKDLKSLGCEEIQVLRSLKILNLNFNKCSAITDKALGILSNGVLRKLTGLKNLNLSFEKCEKVTDEGLKRLACDGIQYLQSLKGLNLSFSGCSAITNEGLRSLSFEGIAKTRSSLTSLHLNFERCSEITDEGLENLFHDDGFESLTSLDLNFNSCSGLTNKGIEILTRKGLQKFKKCLKMLSLSFKDCSQITDEGLSSLSCEGVSHLESLTDLSLSFSGGSFSKITDKGIMILSDQGIQHLSSLTVLHLTFDKCKQITNEGLQSLYLPNELMTLHLSFNDYKEITDDGLDDLSKKISQLKSLKHLHLSFKNCEKITDNGLGLLCSQGIKSLRKLSVLHLQFGRVSNRSFYQTRRNTMRDQSLKSTKFEGMKYLRELETLNLLANYSSFKKCWDGITDQSLKSIGSEGIRHLTELKTLHLDLEGCCGVTSKGLEYLCSGGIQYLKKLTDLHLSFNGCEAITDEGLEIFSRWGIFPIRHSLKALYLSFDGCPWLSDMGLEGLGNEGIKHLEQLTTLHLQFSPSREITISQLFHLQHQINPFWVGGKNKNFSSNLESQNPTSLWFYSVKAI